MLSGRHSLSSWPRSIMRRRPLVALALVAGVCLLVVLVATCARSQPLANETTLQVGGQQQVTEKTAKQQQQQTTTTTTDDDDDSLFSGLYNMFGGGNPSSTPTGQKLIEGDMVVAPTPRSSGAQQQLAGRKAVPDTSLYWPNGEVIYTYHESINQAEMGVIEAAMRHWSQHTCIRFRQRQASDYVFVRFRSDTQGCWSLVGRQVNSPNGFGQGQDVSIGQGCANLNVVVHEIGHVIGFYHEQSRSDRDQYIEIVWNNVLPGYALQFRKESDTSFNIPYDLTSTMQYPQWAFSKEIFEKSTIVAKNPAYQRFLSKNYPLSFRDRLIANQMYQCTATCSGASGSICRNGGYMRASAAAPECACDCPPNFTGATCETQLRADYYDELPCGGIITQEGKIETPDYPQRTSPGQSCMWDIRAPLGHRVSLRINGFSFAPRFTKPGTKVINKCFNETVEIRLRSANIHDGDTYCGTDIAPGTVLRSDGPRAVVIITANDKMLGQGFSARVRFFREGTTPNDDNDDDQETNDNNDEQTSEANGQQTTAKPETPGPLVTSTEQPDLPGSTTMRPYEELFSTPRVVGPQPPPPPPPPSVVTQTLPPVQPPQPPPSVVTTSSLLEEYEKESKKTLPPVIPFNF